MDLIRIEHPDFCMYVQCDKFEGIWNKALGNMDNDAQRLTCPYNWSGDDVRISINGDECPNKNSQYKAVFFDNTEYFIWVDFEDRIKVKDALFDSSQRKIANSFYYRESKQTLSGHVNYGNEIGKSDIVIEYHLHNGEKRNFRFSYEVLSTKLDYHEHWNEIVRDIEAEYRMLSLDFLKKTYHSFSEGKTTEQTQDLIWWQIFQPLREEFVNAAETILKRPRHRLRTVEMYERADRIKRFTPQLENAYLEHKDNEAYLYRTDMNVNNHNTQENQFFKYALFEIATEHKRLGNKIKQNTGLSDNRKNEIDSAIEDFDNLCTNPFFRTISSWKGVLHNSLVIHRDVHYAEVLRTWSILHESYALNEGLHSLETKDIATLYEIWCYIQMKQIVKKKLSERGEIEVEDADRQEMNVKFTREKIKGKKSRIVFKQNNIELAELFYNEEEDDSNKEFKKQDLLLGEMESLTVPQRPDIMLQLTKNLKEEGFKLTYLFDAKYRISAKDSNNVDCPPPDAIDQMHRYRDAIYYRDHKEGRLKKEIVGGYILFPGGGEKAKIEIASFYESINAVNIGAFPLRPKDNETRLLLEDFVSRLLDRDASDVLEESIPQKGLYYTETLANEEDLVLVVRTRNIEQYNWCIDNKYYNLPLNVVADPSEVMSARFIAIINPDTKKVNGLHKVVRNRYAVWTKDQLNEAEYPHDPSYNAYFMLSLNGKGTIVSSYKGKILSLSDVPVFKRSTSAAYYFVKLGDLLKQIKSNETTENH